MTTPDMSARLQESAARLLEWAESSAAKAIDFASAQTPLIATEYLRWEIVEHGFLFVILAVLSVMFCRGMLFCGREATKRETDGDTSGVFAMFAVVAGTAFAVCFIWAIWEIRASVKPIIAPRVVLVEKLHSLVSERRP